MRVPISLFLLTVLLTFSDFLAFGQLLSGLGTGGLILVVGEACVRTFLVFGTFILVLEAYKVPNLSKRGWFKYFLVTAAICGVPPLTLSVFLRNYLLFTAFRGLEDPLSHLLALASALEFPRLLLAQRIWRKMKMEREKEKEGR